MRVFSLALAVALASPASAYTPGVGLGDQHPTACAPGYHRDRGGNCQPNVAEYNRYCPPGLVVHQEFDGWSCNAPPREAY